MPEPDAHDEAITSDHDHAYEPPEGDSRVREPESRSGSAPASPPPEKSGATRLDVSSLGGRGGGDARGHPGPPGAAFSLTTQQIRSGPLPAALELAEYKVVQEDFPERIVSMAELSVRGRERRSDRIVDAEIRSSMRGQTFALLIALTCLVASIAFFILGNNLAGLAFISLPAVMLVRSFLGHAATSDEPN